MRRAILAASAGFVLPRRGWAESREHAALCWKLEERGDTAHESATGAEDAIASRTGHAIWVGEGRNRALRLDGYSVWFKHDGAPAILHGGVVTVCAWIALESYPVHEAALLQLEGKSGEALRFSIDRWGYLQFGPHPGDPKANCKSSEPVLKAKWTHLAASFGDRGITLYRDGIPCGHLPSSGPDFKLADPVSLAIGIAPDCPVVADVFPTGVLNGLLRDVRVFDAELSGQAIAEIMEESKPDGAPDLQINGSWCASDPHRPIWHALPPRAWTNEPHGLIHWGGQYHLFYQKNPSGPYWGHIHWGHLTSPDLRRWTEMPVALSPEPGPDSEGCWSGSVIDHHGQLAILYTGGDGSRSSICLALSNDGVHFTKHVGNPIIPQPPEGHDFPEFRDPFVWREGDAYYLMIGSAVKDVGGTGLLYHSKDLVSWEYRKQIHKGDHKDSGTFWEMPIFVRAGNYHALAVCEVPGRASYWVGSWKDETFTPISSTPRRLELFNHLLSPTPMIDEDGQVVVMGIIPDERHPKETWAAGWAHLYSLPRVLSTDASGLLIQTPHKSIEQRTRQLASFPAINLNGETVSALEGVAETSFRLHATFKKGASRSISVILRRAPSGQEQTEILFEWESGRLVLDRSRSSLDPMVRRDRQEAEYLPLDKDSIRFDVFVDRSVLEVFIDDRATFATRIYPTLDSSCGIGFACTGIGARVEDVGVVRIERTI
jgi:sucrose-6-phosphate hydrolase SacC (GH32 family)